LHLALPLLLDSLIDKLRQVCLPALHEVFNLDYDAATIELNLLALTKVVFAVPVHVPNRVPALVIDHDACVECVILESSILPSFLLAAQVMREETAELEHGRG
jgi:hypothetical protein